MHECLVRWMTDGPLVSCHPWPPTPTTHHLLNTGLIKNYTFDTTSNTTQPCTELFCPLYSLGIAPDPLRQAATARRRSLLQSEGGGSGGSGTAPPEVYAAVGLDSGVVRATLHPATQLQASCCIGAPLTADACMPACRQPIPSCCPHQLPLPLTHPPALLNLLRRHPRQ